MCIIAIKKAGVEMPTDEIISNMWINNSDGAGIMYTDGGIVHIRKGYMTLKAFRAALDDLSGRINLKNTPVVMHFRIGTSGGNTPANTHPFPVSEHVDALQKTRVKTSLGVAHNGIISIKPSRKDISDTMEYVSSQLSLIYKLDKSFYTREAGRKLVYNGIQSKMVFLDKNGYIQTVGKFETGKDGIIYSNSSYEPRISYKNWDLYGDYEDDFYNSDYYRFRYGGGLLGGKTDVKRPETGLLSLMWLDDSDGYIIDDAGNIFEAGDYLIDADNNLYTLNEDDICCPIDGTAYTHENTYLHYDETRADFYDVLF